MTTITKAVGGIDVVQKGIGHFLEGSKVLMGALDEVAKIHPFVSGMLLKRDPFNDPSLPDLASRRINFQGRLFSHELILKT